MTDSERVAPREKRPTGRVLSIETGFGCNTDCAFCPQIDYRTYALPHDPLDLGTAEILERLEWGAANGYTQVGFSGGETSMREDFLEIVARARDLRFELIAVTTNGVRFADREFTEAAIAAGLNGINISVHGVTAGKHDSMMRATGSFAAAVRALDHFREHRSRGVPLRLMSMCLASPQTLQHFPDIVRLMGEKGIRLHMLQPFLLSKGNTQFARHFFATYAEIADAIRRAVPVARAHGGHVKLFNTPVCLLWDVEESLERQQKKLDVFREHERASAGESQRLITEEERPTPVGYYRIPECVTCDEPCNGFRAEYYPQEEMVSEICATVDANLADSLWIAGTELLTADSLREVLMHCRARGVRRLALLTAAIGRAYTEQFDAARDAAVDEICFVVHPRRRDFAGFDDRHHAHGNVHHVAASLRRLEQFSGYQPEISLLVADRSHAATLPGVGRMRLRTADRPGDLPGPIVPHRWTTAEFTWIAWSVPPDLRAARHTRNAG